MTTPSLYGRGCGPDLPDHRDYLYKHKRPLTKLRSILAPSSAYLRDDLLQPIKNQGPLGSCVGNGVAKACGYVEGKEGHPEELSRLAIYYWARGGVPEDSGATIRNGIKAVVSNGVPLESVWPYDISKWKDAPSPDAVAEGAHRKVGLVYYRLTSLSEIKDCLRQGFPVVFGTVIFKQFMDVSHTGLVLMPRDDDAPGGGHCMIMVGYTDKIRLAQSTGGFEVQNSWGPNWGMNGRCWLSYEYTQKFAWDFWTVQKIAE